METVIAIVIFKLLFIVTSGNDFQFCELICVLDLLEKLESIITIIVYESEKIKIMNMKIVLIKIFPNHGNSYYVTLTIDNIFNEEEQVDIWVEDNLKDVAFWKRT